MSWILVVIMCMQVVTPSRSGVVLSTTEVYPGNLFSVSITVFGSSEAYAIPLHPFFELVPGDDATQQSDSLIFRAVVGPGPTTLYALLRVVQGALPTDVTWPGGQVTRICCLVATWPAQQKQYLPVLLH